MTVIQFDATSIFMGFIKYIGFVWSVSWRTLCLSLLCAVFVGVLLGVLSGANIWPPEVIDAAIPYMGLPISLVVFLWVLIRRILHIL